MIISVFSPKIFLLYLSKKPSVYLLNLTVLLQGKNFLHLKIVLTGKEMEKKYKVKNQPSLS